MIVKTGANRTQRAETGIRLKSWSLKLMTIPRAFFGTRFKAIQTVRLQTRSAKRTKMKSTLEKDVEKRLIASIRRYVSENLEIEIGELQSSLFLQFCVEEIGPSVYNQAISDAQTYMQEKALDLDNTCFAIESTYWSRQEKLTVRGRSIRKKT
jgi:uncharacterized protein (DUF2164 family)